MVEEKGGSKEENRGHEMCVSPFFKMLFGGWLVGWVEGVRDEEEVREGIGAAHTDRWLLIQRIF